VKENDFDRKWLDLLVCPKTGQELTYDSKKKLLLTKDKKISYAIKEGIPRLIDD
tara:strand:- start:366 stop:527 length:162 start_codon:yes stop_codon:yes gene_type:complete